LKTEELRTIIDALEGFCQEMEAGQQFVAAPATGRLGPPGEELLLLRMKLPGCFVVKFVRHCDISVVPSEPVPAGGSLQFTKCDLEGTTRVKRGSGFCICNRTGWKIRITFDCAVEIPSGPIVLDPDAYAYVAVSNTNIGQSPTRCAVGIERWENGMWVFCSGSGGGTDLQCEDP